MTFASRFTQADIEEALAQYEAGADRKELCARLGVSVRTLFRWQARQGKNRPALLKLVSNLHEENLRLRELLGSAQRGSPVASD